MRILLVNTLDARYGSTYRARHLRAALSGAGHAVTYLESNSTGTGDGVRSVLQRDGLPGYLRAGLGRARLCLRLPYDILYVQKFTPPAAACIAAGKARGKTVAVDWDDLDTGFQTGLVRRAATALTERFFPPAADIVTTHSTRLAERARALGARRVHLVPQVVDTGLYDPARYDTALLKKEAGLEGRTVLGYLCTLTGGGARDLDVVLRSFARWAREFPEAFLLIIGGGPLEERIAALVRETGLAGRCRITGLMPQERVPGLLALCDLGLVFMRDGQANRMRVSFKALEYLAMERKVIGTLVGETKDRVGRFCPDAPDEEAFYRAVAETLRAKDFSPADDARAYVARHHSPEAMRRSLAEAFTA